MCTERDLARRAVEMEMHPCLSGGALVDGAGRGGGSFGCSLRASVIWMGVWELTRGHL